ncbi:hypothetical protein TIFTF001_007378 [Ficus carica]|uniref:SCD domain-containing protein n=1 Tax=Ficus carica TaxID=3494 RepID=A0AA88DGG2_FICCA|nr:hypothetical protein TIFTF001_007378 [Ficus carica]
MEDQAPATEPSIRRSKRTRAQTQVTENQKEKGNGAAGGENSDGSNQADRESSPDDFEEARPRAKRSRPQEGTSAVAGHKSTEQSLIEVIKGNGKYINQAVKLWVEQYEKDPKPAIVELLTMLFEACGAKYHIKGEFLDEIDVDDVVVALVDLARRGEVEDYQSSKKKELKNFKDNLQSFWDTLVRECQHGPLYDQVLFDKCMDYIIALSCTPPRVYRQIASFMGLQLVTSFIAVAKVLGAQRETTRRQLDAETKKRAEGPRVESLNKRFSVTHEKITTLEEMMRKIFTGLFMHRYRDIDPNIRMSCIESLGSWILSYPSLFLQDLYLKYLGWTLNDKSAGVRKASVLALQNLYEVDDNVPTLGLFTERFSNRMIELADDNDISVAVCAIGLVKQLLRHQLLPDDDLGPLYDLLIDEPAEIRHAIGALVYDHLIAQKFNSSQSSTKGEGSDSSEVHLGRMLQILREFSTDQILSIYVIDDVWEYMKAMKEAFDNNRKDITIAMMKNYPLLLRKFMADKAKVPSLVEIIVHMNLELYSLKRQEQNFKNVLQLIKEAFFKHGEKDALRSCVQAINFCSVESQGELKDFARSKLKEVEDEIVAKLKSAMKEVADGGDEYSLLVNLKRLYELQLSRAVPIEGLHEDIVNALQNFRNMDYEVVSFLLLNMFAHLAWSLHSVISSEIVSEASLSSLLSKRKTLLDQLEYFLNSPPQMEGTVNYGNQLASRYDHAYFVLQVCTILAEAWSLFRRTIFSSTKLERLGYCPDVSIVQKFWRLCEQQLNISDETEDEDANKEYVEETSRDMVMVAAAKLVANDTVPKDYLAPDIISHYVMHGVSVTETVKNLIGVLRKRDDDLSNIFLDALKKAYDRHMVELSRSDDESLATKYFQDCKELSARLSATFVGAARNKHRVDILKIVKDGIEHAFVDAPKQLSFLECSVLHFVSRLPTPDIQDIMKDVQKRTENVNTDEDPSGWRPYYTFIDSLREKYAKNEGLQDEKEGAVVKRRGRPRKQRSMEGRRLFDEQSSSEEEDSISTSDHENAQDDDDEEEDAPLIHSIRSSKLRSLKVSREETKSQSKTGESSKAKD